jgi:hypothetical protein
MPNANRVNGARNVRAAPQTPVSLDKPNTRRATEPKPPAEPEVRSNADQGPAAAAKQLIDTLKGLSMDSQWKVVQDLSPEQTRWFLETVGPIDSAMNAEILKLFKSLRVLHGAIGLVNKTDWKQAVVGQGYQSVGSYDFARWVRGEISTLPRSYVQTNCWEVILLAAYKSGVLTRERIANLYDNAAAVAVAKEKELTEKLGADEAKKSGIAFEEWGRIIMEGLAGGYPTKSMTIQELKANPPTAGDIVFFGNSGEHVALSFGGNELSLLSSWSFPRNGMTMTTIEELARVSDQPISVVKPIWE